MAFSYGLTFPAAYLRYQSVPPEVYPDLFKFYTNGNTGNRRPHLWSSLNGGINWDDEQSGNTGFYAIEYGGNFIWNNGRTRLEALGHQSQSSSYSSYSGYCTPTLSRHGWTKGKARAYSGAGCPHTDVVKLVGSNKCYCEGMYNNNSYNYYYASDGITATSWSSMASSVIQGTNATTTSDKLRFQNSAGFRQLINASDSDHTPYGLAVCGYGKSKNTTNKLRVILFNLSGNSNAKDYTSAAVGSTTLNGANSVTSVGYLPNVGYLVFRNNSSRINYRILRTYDPETGDPYAYNAYVSTSTYTIGSSSDPLVADGCSGWYCPWTKEYFLCANGNTVLWTTDGINWSSSAATGIGYTNKAIRFLTDGVNMVVASSSTAFKYSTDKGQTWHDGTSLSSNGFYTEPSSDAIVLPFTCTNNLINGMPSVTLGYWLNDTDGEPQASASNLYTNDYIPIDPDTSYVFYGRNKNTKIHAYSNRITFYDSNKEWISTVEGDQGTWKVSWPAIYTSPSNAAFARFSMRPYSSSDAITQSDAEAYKYYFAKESDFAVMTDYGDILGY